MEFTNAPISRAPRISVRRPVHYSPVKLPGSGTLGVGVLGQEIHFVLGGDADDFADIGQIVKLIEQRFELLGGRYPEQRPRRLVRLVEIAVRNAAGQAYQVAGLGLHPNAIELEIQPAVLDQDEFILGRMDMNRDKLAGVAVGLESKGRI